MNQTTHLTVNTPGRGLYPITPEIKAWLSCHSLGDGLLHVWIKHTSASLIVTENADPDVLRDHETFLSRLVPDGDPIYRHSDEGPDDMPAHIRSILTQTSLTIPIRHGRLALGVWQGIYVWEHRTSPHQRTILLTSITDERGGHKNPI